MASASQLTQRVALLVEQASDGVVGQQSATEGGRTFTDLGLTSLAYLRLLDSIETELGVYVDLDDETVTVNSVESVVAYIQAQDVTA